jgi:hypothetical protein
VGAKVWEVIDHVLAPEWAAFGPILITARANASLNGKLMKR